MSRFYRWHYYRKSRKHPFRLESRDEDNFN